MEAACRRAVDHADPRYGTVKTILTRGLDQLVPEPAAELTLTQAYTSQGRYCRDTRQMFLFPVEH